jgi:hypothetical protein
MIRGGAAVAGHAAQRTGPALITIRRKVVTDGNAGFGAHIHHIHCDLERRIGAGR